MQANAVHNDFLLADVDLYAHAAEAVDCRETVFAIKKPVIWVTPFASAPNMTARWEMDLSPGTVMEPRSPADGLILIIKFLIPVGFG